MADVFLAGCILAFLIGAQLYKVYKADKEYKEELEDYLKHIK